MQTVVSWVGALILAGACSSAHPRQPDIPLTSTREALEAHTFQVGELVPHAPVDGRTVVEIVEAPDGFLLRLNESRLLTGDDCVTRLSPELAQVDLPPRCHAPGVVRSDGAKLRRFWFRGEELYAQTLDGDGTLEPERDVPALLTVDGQVDRRSSFAACAPDRHCLVAWAERGEAKFVRVGADNLPLEPARALGGPGAPWVVRVDNGFRLFTVVRQPQQDGELYVLSTARVGDDGSVAEATHSLYSWPYVAGGTVAFAAAGERSLVALATGSGQAGRTLGLLVDGAGTLTGEPREYAPYNSLWLRLASSGQSFLLGYTPVSGEPTRLQPLDADGVPVAEAFEARLPNGNLLDQVVLGSAGGRFVVVGKGAFAHEVQAEPHAFFVSAAGVPEAVEPRPVARVPSRAYDVAAEWAVGHYVVAWTEARASGTLVRVTKVSPEGVQAAEPPSDLTSEAQGNRLLSMASANGSTLLLFQDNDQIWARAVENDGWIAWMGDPVRLPSLELASARTSDGFRASVASDGWAYAAVVPYGCGARFLLLDSDGQVRGVPLDISETCSANSTPSEAFVIWTGTHYWVTWLHDEPAGFETRRTIKAVVVTPDGTVSSVTPIAYGPLDPVGVAPVCGGGECLYVWQTEDGALFYRRFDAKGEPLSEPAELPDMNVWAGMYGEVSMVWDGGAFVLQYAEHLTHLWPGGGVDAHGPEAFAFNPRVLASNHAGQTLVYRQSLPFSDVPWVPMTMELIQREEPTDSDAGPAPEADGGVPDAGSSSDHADDDDEAGEVDMDPDPAPEASRRKSGGCSVGPEPRAPTSPVAWLLALALAWMVRSELSRRAIRPGARRARLRAARGGDSR